MAKSEVSPYDDIRKNFGMTAEQAIRDISKGHAEPRNSAEIEAAKDFVDEALATGEDPLGK